MQTSNMVLFVCAGLLLYRRRAKRQTSNNQQPQQLRQPALPRNRTPLAPTTPKESKALETSHSTTPEEPKAIESHRPTTPKESKAIEAHHSTNPNESKAIESHRPTTLKESKALEDHHRTTPRGSKAIEAHHPTNPKESKAIESHRPTTPKESKAIEAHHRTTPKESKAVEAHYRRTPKESNATNTNTPHNCEEYLYLYNCSERFWDPEASGGSLLGGATAWNLLRMSYYFWTTDLGAELGAMSLFVAGALLCLPICWLATIVPYHRRSLPLMGTLIFMSTSSLLLLTTGVSSMMGLSNTLRQPDVVNASMHRALAQVAVNSAVEGAFQTMQLDNKCCGVNYYSDWQHLYHTLPPSCCNRMKNNRSEVCDKPVHSLGCLRPALYELRYFINSVSVLASSIIVILAVTIFAASYSLVDNVLTVEKPMSMRIACLHPVAAPAPASPAPLVSLTSPTMLPSLVHQV